MAIYLKGGWLVYMLGGYFWQLTSDLFNSGQELGGL